MNICSNIFLLIYKNKNSGDICNDLIEKVETDNERE